MKVLGFFFLCFNDLFHSLSVCYELGLLFVLDFVKNILKYFKKGHLKVLSWLTKFTSCKQNVAFRFVECSSNVLLTSDLI